MNLSILADHLLLSLGAGLIGVAAGCTLGWLAARLGRAVSSPAGRLLLALMPWRGVLLPGLMGPAPLLPWLMMQLGIGRTTEFVAVALMTFLLSLVLALTTCSSATGRERLAGVVRTGLVAALYVAPLTMGSMGGQPGQQIASAIRRGGEWGQYEYLKVILALMALAVVLDLLLGLLQAMFARRTAERP